MLKYVLFLCFILLLNYHIVCFSNIRELSDLHTYIKSIVFRLPKGVIVKNGVSVLVLVLLTAESTRAARKYSSLPIIDTVHASKLRTEGWK